VNRCSDCDPLLAAGHARCPECGRAAYPADAAWLPSGDIVAVYEAACEHLAARAWVVDLLQLVPGSVWCSATAATTGAPCRRRARPGGAHCWLHDPARVRPGGAP
jgi:hypothetical protein